MAMAGRVTRRRRVTYIPYIPRFGPTQQLDPLLQPILFPHLLQLHHLGAVPAHQEPDIGKGGADARGGSDEEVDAFSVDEAGDDYYCYYPSAALSLSLRE